MTIRSMAILLAGAALGLTGCGGAAHPTASTVAQSASAAPPAPGDTTTATPSATSTAPAHASKSSTTHSTSTADPSTTHTTHSTSTASPAASRPAAPAHPPAAHRSHRQSPSRSNGADVLAAAKAKLNTEAKHWSSAALVFPPMPKASPATAAVKCMRAGGLYDIARRPNGAWVGSDPSNAQPLYVAGPYSTAASASQAANSLTHAEYARSGGLYVGFATFRSQLSGELRTVTSCLARGGPKHILKF